MVPNNELLRAEGIWKFFGAVVALQDVDIMVSKGEVLGLVGDNGAGKSTFIKIVSGILQPDRGQLFYEGSPVTIKNPRDARELGIETVYQDLALANNLKVYENVFLGKERLRPFLPYLGKIFKVLDRRSMRNETGNYLKRLEIEFPYKALDRPVEYLSGGQRQAVAIAKSAFFGPKLLIMDEPTAALGVAETARVLDLVRRLKSSGIGIIFISHELEDVLSVADRIVVLKNGYKVGERTVANTSKDEIASMIVTGEDVQLTSG